MLWAMVTEPSALGLGGVAEGLGIMVKWLLYVWLTVLAGLAYAIGWQVKQEVGRTEAELTLERERTESLRVARMELAEERDELRKLAEAKGLLLTWDERPGFTVARIEGTFSNGEPVDVWVSVSQARKLLEPIEPTDAEARMKRDADKLLRFGERYGDNTSLLRDVQPEKHLRVVPSVDMTPPVSDEQIVKDFGTVGPPMKSEME